MGKVIGRLEERYVREKKEDSGGWRDGYGREEEREKTRQRAREREESDMERQLEKYG